MVKKRGILGNFCHKKLNNIWANHDRVIKFGTTVVQIIPFWMVVVDKLWPYYTSLYYFFIIKIFVDLLNFLLNSRVPPFFSLRTSVVIVVTVGAGNKDDIRGRGSDSECFRSLESGISVWYVESGCCHSLDTHLKENDIMGQKFDKMTFDSQY